MSIYFSERIVCNMADYYILQFVGFPIERIGEFNEIFMHMEESLYKHVCSLAEPINVEKADYSDLILPNAKLKEFRQHIESHYPEVSVHAKSILWAIVAQYLWKHADRVLSQIKYERRLKDPDLGEFFRLLEDAKKNGLFSGTGLLE